MKVGIINVTGYSGSELARILRRHPRGGNRVGYRDGAPPARSSGEVFPHLESLDLTIEPELSGSLDLVFLGTALTRPAPRPAYPCWTRASRWWISAPISA